MKILFVAGELSGDRNASFLINKLREKSKDLEIYAYAGKESEKQGAILIEDITHRAVVGFTEAFGTVFYFKNLLKEIYNFVRKKNIKKVVLVDFPGFNLNLARILKRIDREIFYFIPPQVWAWGSWRIKELRKYTDKVLSTFPFEAEFLRKKKVNAFFVGNPIVERIRWNENKEKIIIFLPGSRKKEIKRHVKDMIRIRDYIERDFKDYRFLISLLYSDSEILSKVEGKFEIIEGEAAPYIEKARYAITVSGTAALECALAGTPMVVIYKVSEFTYVLGRMLTKIPYVSLVNIILKKRVIPEYVQHINLKEIREFLVTLNSKKEKLEEIISSLKYLRQILKSEKIFNPVYLILNKLNKN
ncbi:MAG: lipid-A-disaccharide synthase [Candidatus Hydrothermales bacterium]